MSKIPPSTALLGTKMSFSFYFFNEKFPFFSLNFFELIEPEITHVQSLLALSGYVFDADDCIFYCDGEIWVMD